MTFSSPNFLPIIKNTVNSTIGVDLVSVKPMPSPSFNTEEEISRMESEILESNRNSKIESIVENVDYKELNIEDHPDFKSHLPFYIDYSYNVDKGPTPSGSIEPF